MCEISSECCGMHHHFYGQPLNIRHEPHKTHRDPIIFVWHSTMQKLRLHSSRPQTPSNIVIKSSCLKCRMHACAFSVSSTHFQLPIPFSVLRPPSVAHFLPAMIAPPNPSPNFTLKSTAPFDNSHTWRKLQYLSETAVFVALLSLFQAQHRRLADLVQLLHCGAAV